MLIDKLEFYSIQIAELQRRKIRHQLSQLLKNVNFPSPIHHEFYKNQNAYLLRVHMQKQALPYLLSFLSFHHYTIYQVIRTKSEAELLPIEQLKNIERRYDYYIDGLTDPFIKDKVIEVLHQAPQFQLKYTIRKNLLTLTSTVEEASNILSLLARHHIDICQVYSPSQPQAHMIRIS